MQTSEAIRYFGNMARLAKALGVSRTTVWQWHHSKGGRIPADFAAQIHVLTSGEVPFDVQKYGARE